MSALPNTYLSPEEYLAIERRSEYKSEYSNGEMFAMSGASLEHNRITVNLLSDVKRQLRSGSCEPFGSDMRVEVPLPRKYVYPDLSIVCGEPEFADSEFDTLVNPLVVFEVLSPSTERFDRGTKFVWYRRVSSLREYVLVSQAEPRVERFVRRGQEWVLTEATGLDAAIRLETVGCDLALADIYERVDFPEDCESAVE